MTYHGHSIETDEGLRSIIEKMEREEAEGKKRLDTLEAFLGGISFWKKDGEWDHEEVVRIATADKQSEEAFQEQSPGHTSPSKRKGEEGKDVGGEKEE